MPEFIFRLPDGKEVGRAKNLREFLKKLKEVPLESLEYHFYNKHFAPWLKDNGHGKLVARMNLVKVKSREELRDKLVACVKAYMDSTSKSRKGKSGRGRKNAKRR